MKRAVVIVGLGIALAACGSSSKPSALQATLEKYDQIQLSPLPPHATTISKHEAEEIASNTKWMTPPGKRPRLSAALWRVTDPRWYIPEHGIHRLLVNKQVDWIVLVHGVNIAGVPGPSDLGATGANGPTRATAQWKPMYGTAAVAINAESGRQVDSWTLPRRGS